MQCKASLPQLGREGEWVVNINQTKQLTIPKKHVIMKVLDIRDGII